MTDQDPLSIPPLEGAPPPEDSETFEYSEALVQELLSAVEKRGESAGDEEELNTPLEAESLLRDAVREHASDIHLDSQRDGVLVRLRIDGKVLDGTVLEHLVGKRLGNQLKGMCGLDPVTTYVPQEGRGIYEADGVLRYLRMVHAPCLNGDKISLRVLDPTLLPRTLTQLGLQSAA